MYLENDLNIQLMAHKVELQDDVLCVDSIVILANFLLRFIGEEISPRE